MTEETAPEPTRVYQCPDPDCLVTRTTAEEISDHVNDEHDGDWDDDRWPSEDDNDGWNEDGRDGVGSS